MYKNVVIFGAGSAGKKVANWLPVIWKTIAFIDNDPDKQGTFIDKTPIYSPDWLIEARYDCILVASDYASEICALLHKQKISEHVIEVEGFSNGLMNSEYPWYLTGMCLRPRFHNAEINMLNITKILSEYRILPIYRALNLIKDRLSMLHVDVMQLLWHLVRYSNDSVLEIGPYLGGSTVAMGLAMKQRNKSEKIVTIEAGGSNPGLHFISSDNIITELDSNIKAFSCDDVVNIIEGDSRNDRVINQVTELLEKDSVTIVFHDADGRVDLDIEAHQDCIANEFYLVVDDYISPNDPEKEQRTRESLSRLDKILDMEHLGVYGWGTLFLKAKFIMPQ